jgi:hypothetical protein
VNQKKAEIEVSLLHPDERCPAGLERLPGRCFHVPRLTLTKEISFQSRSSECLWLIAGKKRAITDAPSEADKRKGTKVVRTDAHSTTDKQTKKQVLPAEKKPGKPL